ncbi:MAG: hypothetical protein LBH44_12800 [Treponema sp.]|jgi:hypothetical protein|nr:hypothetical protein [Treponema sp.]
MIYEKCREILLREHELVANAAGIQGKIRLAVTNREWTDFEGHFNSMNSIENELAALEKAREALLTASGASDRQNEQGEMDAKGRFYAVVSLLPENQRNDLTSIYRALKLEAIKLRMANEELMNYLAGVKATLSDFFALAFPDRSGKIYTKAGTHSSHDMRSMVLNHSF